MDNTRAVKKNPQNIDKSWNGNNVQISAALSAEKVSAQREEKEFKRIPSVCWTRVNYSNKSNDDVIGVLSPVWFILKRRCR